MRALCLAALIGFTAAGCASEPLVEPPRRRLGDAPVYVAPVEDASSALSESERGSLHAEVRKGLEAIAAREKKAKKKSPLAIVDAPDAAAHRLALRVERFEPEGNVAKALVVGLGAGRPAWEIHLALSATGTAVPLGDRDFEKESSAYRDPPPKGGREVMLRDIAETAVAFVRRRR